MYIFNKLENYSRLFEHGILYEDYPAKVKQALVKKVVKIEIHDVNGYAQTLRPVESRELLTVSKELMRFGVGI